MNPSGLSKRQVDRMLPGRLREPARRVESPRRECVSHPGMAIRCSACLVGWCVACNPPQPPDVGCCHCGSEVNAGPPLACDRCDGGLTYATNQHMDAVCLACEREEDELRPPCEVVG